MNDQEIAELDKILERHVDELIERELGPNPTPQHLFGLAQELEENADSYGANPVRYRRADVAWEKAFDAAERIGEASLKERLAATYGWSTPTAREAQGPPLEEVPKMDYVEGPGGLREIDLDDALKELGLDRDEGFGYEL